MHFYPGNTKGLLGVWNGDISDDLQAENGDTIPLNDATSQVIFTSFGETCKLWDANMFFYD